MLQDDLWRTIGLAMFCLASLSLSAGCGSGAARTNQNDPSRIRLKTLALEYSHYRSSNGGKPPASEADFKAYVANQGKMLLTERGIKNADDLFVSPRDGQPLVIACGAQRKMIDGIPEPIVAHEQTGVNGRYLAAFSSGAVVEMDSETFDKLPK